jgi:hypothetical protein
MMIRHHCNSSFENVNADNSLIGNELAAFSKFIIRWN